VLRELPNAADDGPLEVWCSDKHKLEEIEKNWYLYLSTRSFEDVQESDHGDGV